MRLSVPSASAGGMLPRVTPALKNRYLYMFSGICCLHSLMHALMSPLCGVPRYSIPCRVLFNAHFVSSL